MTNSPPFVSVIVPCRNEAPHIEACLESIRASTYPEDAVEIIVVDGSSDDGTPEIALSAPITGVQ